MAEEEWYYTRQGQRMGPYSSAQMKAAYERREFTDSDYVWTSGMANWAPAGQVRDQFLRPAEPDPLAALGIPRVDFDLYQPATHVRPVVVGTVGEFAGFWLRAVAAVIDMVLLTVVLVTLDLILANLLGISGEPLPGQPRTYDLPPWLNQIRRLDALNDLAVLLYFTIMESSALQATVGKLAVGIQVTDRDGDRISFWRALGRNLARILSGCLCFVGYIMAGLTERKQALHDVIAGTLVTRN